MNKRLYRSDQNKILAGVCGGIGEYFEIDPVVIRVVWIILTFIGGAGLLAYIIAALIIPRDGTPSRFATAFERADSNLAEDGQSAETAYSSGNGFENRPPEGSQTPNTAKRTRSGILVLGTALVVLGLLVLFRGYLPGLDPRTLGAGALIVLGLYLIVMRVKD